MEEKVEQMSDTATNDKVITYEEYKALEDGFYEERQKMEERIWLDSNSSKFDDILRQNYEQSVRKFSENIINYIAKITNAVYGAFFIVDHDKNIVKATAGYACTVETMERSKFNMGEGLIGQVARSQDTLSIDNVETELNSSLGRINATFLLITPLVFNQKIYGVIEINTLGKPEQRYLTLIERLSHSIASTLQSIINNQRTKQLLIESLQQAEDFKMQEEELAQLREKLAEAESKLKITEAQLEPNSLTGVDEQIVVNSEGEMTDLHQALETKTQELQETQKTLEEVQTELATARKLAEAMEVEDKELSTSHTQLQEKITTLETQLQEQQKYFEDALAESESKNQTLQKQLELKQKELTDALNQLVWQEENSSAEETIADLQAKLDAKQKELTDALNQAVWQEQEDNNETVIAELQAKLDVKQKELSDALNQLIWQEDDTEDNASSLLANAEIEHLQKEISRKNEEISSLRQALQEAEANDNTNEITQLQKEYDELKETHQSIEQEYKTLSEAQQTLEGLEQEIAQNQRDVNSLRETIKWKDQEIERQDEAFAEQKRKINTLSEVLNEKEEENFKHLEEIVRQGKQLSTQAQEIHQLKQEVEAQSSQQEIRQELELLQMKLKRKEDELMVTQYLLKQQEKGEMKEVVENLQQQLSDKDSEIQKLMSNHQTNESSTNSEEMQQLLRDLQSKENFITQQEEALKQLREQMLEKEKQNEQLQKMAKESSSQVAPIETLEGSSNELNEKLQELENIQEDLRQKEEEVTQQAQTISEQAENLVEQQEAIAKTREENETLAKQIEAQKNEIEHRHNEMQQKESELASLFNRINNAFASLEFDMEGNILSINNKFLMMLGYRIEDLQGRKYEKLLQAEFVQTSEYRILWEALKMGVAQNQENFICVGNKDKQIKMNVSFIPIIGAHGRPYEVVMLVNHVLPDEEDQQDDNSNIKTNVDYTQIEHELGEKLKAIDSSFVLLELDLKGNIVQANKQFLSFLGYDIEEVKDKHHSHFLDVTDRSSVSYQSIIQNLSSGNFASKLLKYIGKEGERIRLRSYFNSLKDAEGNPDKVLVISQFVN